MFQVAVKQEPMLVESYLHHSVLGLQVLQGKLPTLPEAVQEERRIVPLPSALLLLLMSSSTRWLLESPPSGSCLPTTLTLQMMPWMKLKWNIYMTRPNASWMSLELGRRPSLNPSPGRPLSKYFSLQLWESRKWQQTSSNMTCKVTATMIAVETGQGKPKKTTTEKRLLFV